MTAAPGLRGDRPLQAVLLLSLALNLYHLWWGLPNGNVAWAADVIAPMTPLSVAHASLNPGWNSGWFFYKYPIGHPLLLAVLYAPYVGLLWLSGGLSGVGSDYPYGLRSPEVSLAVLALIGRLTSALMGTATVWLVYRVAERLYGRPAGLAAALGTAGSAALVYYSHTANLDVPCLFWTVLAWALALEGVLDPKAGRLLAAGAAAGMSVATKEQSVGFLLGLGCIVSYELAARVRAGELTGRRVAALSGGALAAAAGVWLLLNNALYNPSGLWHRVQFLTNTLPPELMEKYVPRPSLIGTELRHGLSRYGGLLLDTLRAGSLASGAPWFAVSVAGCVVCVLRDLRRALWVALPVAGYFLVSLGLLPLVTVRYVLPIGAALAVCAGAACRSLWEHGLAGRLAVSALLACTLAYGAGVDYLLANDPRYEVERWLRDNARPGMTLETYHEPVLSPRFPPWLSVVRPRFDEISASGLARRRPDLVLVNLANLERITRRHRRDSADLRVRRENEEFLADLLAGRLGYRPRAKFEAGWPVMPSAPVGGPMIRSLAPPFVLFARGDDGEPGAGRARRDSGTGANPTNREYEDD